MKYNHQTAVLREKKEAERIVRCCKKAGMPQKKIDEVLEYIHSQYTADRTRLITGMKSLNKEQIELLYCVFVEGRSFLEFAELKGISKGAVSQRFRVIKNKLNKNIK